MKVLHKHITTILIQSSWVLVMSLLPTAKSLALEIGSNAVLTRMENARCSLLLSVGRIEGTAMPPEWAASGVKLGLPLEIQFKNEACAEYEMNKERLLGSGKPSFRAVEVLTEPTITGTTGLTTVRVTPGAYGCDLQQVASSQYSFRFFLDFPEGAVRNDVELPAERIYFLSSCWIDDPEAIGRARTRRDETRRALDKAREESKRLAEAPTNLFQRLASLRQATLLFELKQKLEARLSGLEQTYPLTPEAILQGPNGMLFPKEGTIAVKRYVGALEREQYHFVGTFAFKEFFDNNEVEN